jgi:hypothetical protein
MNKQQVNEHIDSILQAINDYEKQDNQLIKSEIKDYIFDRYSDLEVEFFVKKKWDTYYLERMRDLDLVVTFIEGNDNE